MTKETMYVYLGTNGTICSPVHLEGVYHVKKVRLRAAEGYSLTKNGENFYSVITVPENEVSNWYEVAKVN